MSLIVSRRPSSRNHWNEAFWMSIRLGRSRTCGRREKDLRARGEATLVVKKSGLPVDERDQANSGVQTDVRRAPDGLDVGATSQDTESGAPTASKSRGERRNLTRRE